MVCVPSHVWPVMHLISVCSLMAQFLPSLTIIVRASAAGTRRIVSASQRQQERSPICTCVTRQNRLLHVGPLQSDTRPVHSTGVQSELSPADDQASVILKACLPGRPQRQTGKWGGTWLLASLFITQRLGPTLASLPICCMRRIEMHTTAVCAPVAGEYKGNARGRCCQIGQRP